MKRLDENIRFGGLAAVLLMLMAVCPDALFAQVDDIYFVPTKKQEKDLVVKSTEEKYKIQSDKAKGIAQRDVDEYNRRIGYTNDPESYVDEYYGDEEYAATEYEDYEYSTRIVRFRSPRSAFGSVLYWDLAYGCGINDWLVYDNGYSIDIYPTVNNPLYSFGSSFFWNSVNYYNWRNWYYDYDWRYYSTFRYWDYGHWHPYGYCAPGYHAHLWGHAGNWNYHVPTNGSTRNWRSEPMKRPSGSSQAHRNGKGVNLRGGKGNGNVASGNRENNGKVNLRSGNRKPNDAAVSGSGRELRVGSGKKAEGQARPNRQQPVRNMQGGSNNADKGNVRDGGGRSRSTQAVNSGVNGGNAKNVRGSSGGSVQERVNRPASRNNNRGVNVGNRRGSSSSGNYNRPSSTGVTRSRSTSTPARSSSGASYGNSRSRSGSSYSSGSSRSSSGSSYGNSGSSRSSSGSSYSSGGSSRGGSGGGFSGGGATRSGGGGGRGR